MSNDERIILELEARSRRSPWGREVYETGWFMVKSESMRGTVEMLTLPCPGPSWVCIPMDAGSKDSAGL